MCDLKSIRHDHAQHHEFKEKKIFNQNQLGDECVERLGTLKCMVIIYRLRKRKERCKVTVYNYDKVKL